MHPDEIDDYFLEAETEENSNLETLSVLLYFQVYSNNMEYLCFFRVFIPHILSHFVLKRTSGIYNNYSMSPSSI